jgi:arylsulfatase A-like enzyme
VLALVGDFFAGELLDTLRVIDATGETVVAIAGTHGESIGERDVWFDHGLDLDDSVLRVPLVVRAPGSAAVEIREPVSLLDVAPTLASLAGAPPFRASGRDLAPALRGEVIAPADGGGMPAALDPPQGATAIAARVGGRWRVERDAAGVLRAFDLADAAAAPFDPSERDDAELRALVAALEGAPPPAAPGPAIPLSPQRRAGLVALGYAEERLPSE